MKCTLCRVELDGYTLNNASFFQCPTCLTTASASAWEALSGLAGNRKHGPITGNDVRSIRKRLKKGEKPLAISIDFKCHPNVIYNIKHGKAWKYVR